MSLTDILAAETKYAHFETESFKNRDLTDARILSYETLGWERVTDKLWAIHMTICTNNTPNGMDAYFFIGKIDGEYKIMERWDQVPQELSGDLDMNQFIPDSVVFEYEIMK